LKRSGEKFEYNSYSSFLTTMGNIWGSEKIRTVNGTYLGDKRQRQRRHVEKPLEEPLLEADAPPKEHWKVKALRIIHYIAERSRILNRGMRIQTEG
jgi:hypothetical protein